VKRQMQELIEVPRDETSREGSMRGLRDPCL
jgi:hypothetical protein